MEYVYACIEQLDLAAEQLKRENAALSRIALILTDNIVELMLHRQCKDVRRGESPVWYPVDGEVRRDAFEAEMSRDFAVKVKFCAKIERVTASERDFILIAHTYRNQLYHEGILYDDMIYDLAWQYHSLACGLFSKLPICSWRHRFHEQYSPVVARYMGLSVPLADMNGVIAKASRMLDRAKPLADRALGDALALSALARVQDVERDIRFLLEKDLRQRPEAAVFSELEEQALFHVGIRFREADSENAEKYNLIRNGLRMYRSLITKLRKSPIDGWKNRASAMRKIDAPSDALRAFEFLKQDMSEFADFIHDAAIGLDSIIEQVVDMHMEDRTLNDTQSPLGPSSSTS